MLLKLVFKLLILFSLKVEKLFWLLASELRFMVGSMIVSYSDVIHA